jgi:major outer membrane protein
MVIRAESFPEEPRATEMLKKWKKSLLAAAILGLAANSALAEKLTMEGMESKPISGPPALTMEPKPMAGPRATETLTIPGSSEGPVLHAGTTEQLPMPAAISGAPVEEGPVFFDGDEGIGQQGFFAEVGLHILQPVIGKNTAIRTIVTDAHGNTTADATSSFSWDFSASPSLSVGYLTQNGLGVAVSWFRFDQFSRPRNLVELPANPITGAGTRFISGNDTLSDDIVGAPTGDRTNVFNLSNYMVLDIWDVDVTQNFTLGQMQGCIGGGLRYLHLAQRSFGTIHQTGLDAGEIRAGVDSSGDSFSGIGPMVLADLQRPIGAHNLSIYASARAGLLFGSQHFGDFSAMITNPGGGANTVVTPLAPTTFRGDQTVGFGEIELGIQWSGQVGRFYPVARLGFEGREFLNTGNAQSINGDVGLYGFALHAGVNY